MTLSPHAIYSDILAQSIGRKSGFVYQCCLYMYRQPISSFRLGDSSNVEVNLLDTVFAGLSLTDRTSNSLAWISVLFDLSPNKYHQSSYLGWAKKEQSSEPYFASSEQITYHHQSPIVLPFRSVLPQLVQKPLPRYLSYIMYTCFAVSARIVEERIKVKNRE